MHAASPPPDPVRPAGYACPVEHLPLHLEGGALVSITGRRYPPAAGGWDLRPAAGDTRAAAQAEIYDAMVGEPSSFVFPHNLTLLAQRAWMERLELRAGERVLELGGHRSGVLAWLEGRGAQGDGVDVSPAWVAAQNEAARARGSDTQWVVGDATALPFGDRTFAAAVAFDVLEHVDALEQAVAELFRVLRPGGRLLVHMPVRDIEGSLDGASRARDPADFAARQASVGHYHERMPTRARMRVLLEHVGFRVLDAEPFNVWVQALHDHRLLPWLARLRHRRRGEGPVPANTGPANTGPANAGPAHTGPAKAASPSRWQRAYATTAVPFFAALARVDRLGVRLGVGGSAFFLAERPGEGDDPLRGVRWG